MNPLLKFKVDHTGDDRAVVEVSLKGLVSLGVVYFEKTNNKWGIIDKRVEGLYISGGEKISPQVMVDYCYQVLTSQ